MKCDQSQKQIKEYLHELNGTTILTGETYQISITTDLFV